MSETNNDVHKPTEAEETMRPSDVVSKRRKKISQEAQQVIDGEITAQVQRSLHNQKMEYGMEQWDQNYVRLSDIEEIPGMFVYGEHLQWILWDALPDGPFKRFQETFCDRKDFIIPRTFKAAHGKVWYTLPPPTSVAGCLMDYRKLSKKHRKQFGFVELTDEQERSADFAEAIDINNQSMKKLWDAAVPLQKGNNRMYAIEQPDERVDARYKNAIDPEASVIGALLYLREERDSDEQPYKYRKRKIRKPRTIVMNVYDNVYDAIRKTYHQEYSYEETEIGKLAWLENAIVDVHQEYVETKGPETPETIMQDISDRVRTLVEEGESLLKGVRNPHKKEVKRKLGILQDTVAGNVSATMATLLGAENRTKDRKGEIPPISGFNTDDRMVLIDASRLFEDEFKKRRSALVEKAQFITTITPSEITSEDAFEKNVESFVRNFRTRDFTKKTALLRPFKIYHDAREYVAPALAEAMKKGSTEDSMREALKLHIIGKLQALRTAIEHLKRLLIQPSNMSILSAKAFAIRINEIFEMREIFEGFEDLDLQGIYGPLEMGVSQIVKTVEDLARAETHDDYLQLKKDLERELDSFDPETAAMEVAKIAA